MEYGFVFFLQRIVHKVLLGELMHKKSIPYHGLFVREHSESVRKGMDFKLCTMIMN